MMVWLDFLMIKNVLFLMIEILILKVKRACLGSDLNKVLIHAEDEAKAMGDEYVSVEHLFLCLLDSLL